MLEVIETLEVSVHHPVVMMKNHQLKDLVDILLLILREENLIDSECLLEVLGLLVKTL